MVEPQPSKLMTWVRFPLPAPDYNNLRTIRFVSCFLCLKLKCSLSRKEDNFMLEFEIIQENKPNSEILEIIKNYKYTVKNGKRIL